jgi:hypothetical protein
VLDAGPSLLLDQGARVVLVDASTVRLEAGRALVEAGEGDPLALETSAGTDGSTAIVGFDRGRRRACVA